MIEIKITVKNEEKTVRQEFLCADALLLSEDSEYLKNLVLEVTNSFGEGYSDVIIRTTMQWF